MSGTYELPTTLSYISANQPVTPCTWSPTQPNALPSFVSENQSVIPLTVSETNFVTRSLSAPNQLTIRETHWPTNVLIPSSGPVNMASRPSQIRLKLSMTPCQAPSQSPLKSAVNTSRAPRMLSRTVLKTIVTVSQAASKASATSSPNTLRIRPMIAWTALSMI